MEAAVTNTLAPGEKAILLTAGRWGERWRALGKTFGINVVAVEAPNGSAVKPEQLQAALAEHRDAAAVLTNLSETSTGVKHDIQAFGKLVAATPALFIVDTISGLAAMECRTDDWHVDINVTGSQKALMMPPGLAFCLRQRQGVGQDREDAEPFLLFRSQEVSQQGGRGRHAVHARQHADPGPRVSLKRLSRRAWSRSGLVTARCPAAAVPASRRWASNSLPIHPPTALTVVRVPDGVDGTAVLGKLEKKYGLKLANGQDELKGKIFRLAHMGYIDQFDSPRGARRSGTGAARDGIQGGTRRRRRGVSASDRSISRASVAASARCGCFKSRCADATTLAERRPHMPRVFICDDLESGGRELLKKAGIEIDNRPGLKDDALEECDSAGRRRHRPQRHQDHGRPSGKSRQAARHRAGRRRRRQHRRRRRHAQGHRRHEHARRQHRQHRRAHRSPC